MQKKILDKYILLYLSNLGIFYAYAVLYFSLNNHKQYNNTSLYLGIILICLYYIKKLNIKIKEIQKKKSIYFSLFTLLSGIFMYICLLKDTKQHIISKDSILLFAIFILFIIGEIIYYKKDLDYIKNALDEKIW